MSDVTCLLNVSEETLELLSFPVLALIWSISRGGQESEEATVAAAVLL